MKKVTWGDTVITREGKIGKVTELDSGTFLDTQVSFDSLGVSGWYPNGELSLYVKDN